MDTNDLNARVSVLEAKFDNMEEALRKLDTNANDHRQITLDIKQRLDRQNGLIPHMSEDIKNVMRQQNAIMEKMTASEVKNASQSVKVKIMWTLVGAISAGILTFILKTVLG